MSAPAPCLVVGAGPGLGSAIARRFAAAGHPVGVLGRSSDPLDRLVDELSAGGAAAAAAVADAADPDRLRAGLDRLTGQLGPVGVLVYNAAGYTDGALTALPPQGVHLTTIAGGIGSRPRFAPDTIAQSYLDLHRQPPDQWSFEHQYTD